MGPTKRRIIYPALVVLAAAAAYLNSLSNGFVYDDIVQVVQNHWITSPSYLPEIFSSGVWDFNDMPSNYYRPMMHVFYMAAYLVFGLKPVTFHAMNIILHTSVSVLVYIVARELLANHDTDAPAQSLPPLFTGILFAAHPIHTEAVSWVAGLPDLAMTVFCLLSFYFHIKPIRRDPGRSATNRMLSVTFFMLATLSKEPALVLPVVMLAYDYSYSSMPEPSGGRLRRYGPYASVVFFYILARWASLGGFAPNTAKGDLDIYGVILNGVNLLGMYMAKLALPVNLNAYHSFTPIVSPLEPRWLFSAALVLLLIIASALSLARSRKVFFGIVFTVAPLLPVLYLPAVGNNPFAERYLYLPSFGFVFLSALLACYIINDLGIRRSTVAALVFTISSLFFVVTVDRNTVWKNDVSLWTDTAAKSPADAVPLNTLGLALDAAGRQGEAAAKFLEAITIDPDMADAHVNLGNYYNRAGRLDEAIKQYEYAVLINERNATTHNNLGVAYARSGRLDDAVDEFLIAIEQDERYEDAYINLARTYNKLGMDDEMRKLLSQKARALASGPRRARVRERIIDNR